MSKHKEAPDTVARYVLIDGENHYVKEEFNDHFLFRKTRSISITAKHLEKVFEKGFVVVKIKHRSVTVKASKFDIKDFDQVMTFNGEVKYYYPISKWKVHSGDANWAEKVKL